MDHDHKEDVAMTPEAGAIAVKVGVELLKRATPKGLAWVSHWFKGYKLLIVGQPRAGKTSFVRYLHYGTFIDPTHKAPRTRKIKKTAAFTVTMGRDESLKLEVRSAIDTVGQVSAEEHADNVKKFKPHALIVILDLSAEWNGKTEYAAGFYLTELCIHLSEHLNRNKSLRNKLQSVLIILNKTDLVSSDKTKKWSAYVEALLQSKLSHSYGPKTSDIPVMPCTLVQGKDGGTLADAVTRSLALALS
jgi:hypothetical protein